MVARKVIEVDTIAKYAAKIEELLESTLSRQADASYKGNWYRGIGSASHHKLMPTLYRHPSMKDVEELIKLERTMLEDFERQNVLHTATPMPFGWSNEAKPLLSLFVMQHHGIPTRLLDWTSNPFIALYFALSSAHMTDDAKGYKDDAAIWVLDPVAWNEESLKQVTHGKGGPLSHDSDIPVTGYGPRKIYGGKLEPTAISTLYDSPAAILGVANSARMFAQRGVFTIFGRTVKPLEEQMAAGKYANGTLTKIIIPKRCIGELLQKLLHIGYTDSVSYPDLSGLAMEIKRSRGFRV
ncbi:FRG domain-containing protein [Paraburkholderia tropica]|uniref:FRG domain-containing protein n=1 Tax=Paraburkholderia tropica TaxID=92647 RepID=UPI0016045EEF|nr:FRG domain-containing protein [Paraburkholderia tropica]QNB10798.1 FRG domain-containing protein [Paraburkholderia tropica]